MKRIQTKKNNKRAIFTALLIFATFLLINAPLLHHYGINWDNTRHFARGQSYLRYFLTGEQDYQSLQTNRRSYYQRDNSDFGFWKEHWTMVGHPPLGEISAAGANLILYQKFGILGDTEAYHFYTLLTASLTVAVVFLFTSENLGFFAGSVAALALATYPLFFGEAHFNLKDISQAAFYSSTLYFFYKGTTENKAKYILATAIMAGIAFSTKFNILFAFLTLGFWLLITKRSSLLHLKWPFSKRLTNSLLVFPLIVLLVFWASWPSAIPENKTNILLKTINYYRTIGVGEVYQSDSFINIFGINTYAFQWILYITPIITLVYFILGLGYAFKNIFKKKGAFLMLILLWFAVPLVRSSLPGAAIYGGVRQIMEYVPAMAILAGVGAYWFKSIFKLKLQPFIKIFAFISFMPIILTLYAIHPNENLFFNSLIGGLHGAYVRDFQDWGSSYGNVYRQAAKWLNENAEEGARVTTAFSYASASIPTIWLRDDLMHSNDFRSGVLRRGEYIVERAQDWPSWADDYYYFEYARRFLIPVHETFVDDVAVLTIWKNDLAYTKEQYKHLPSLTVTKDEITQEKNTLIINLEKQLTLSYIGVVFNDPKCSFSPDDIFQTSTDGENWTQQKQDLEGPLFALTLEEFPGQYFYFFDGRQAAYIKIILDKSRPCLKINQIYVNQLSS